MSEKYNYLQVLDEETVLLGESSHSKILRQIRPYSVVLECGPGYGLMTRYLKETLHCEVVILEYDQEGFNHAIQYANKGFCVDLDQDNWVELLGSTCFDYIIFADVLEHLRNPQDVLTKMKRFLKFDGFVLLSVPNIAHGDIIMNLLNDRFTYTPLGLLDYTHIHLFARHDLREMISEAGFYLSYETFVYRKLFSSEQGKFIPQSKRSLLEEAIKAHTLSPIYQYVCRLSIAKTELISDVDKIVGGKDFFSKFYFDIGNGFSEQNVLEISPDYLPNGRIQYNLNLPDGCLAVRYDPVEMKACILRKITVTVDGILVPIQPLNGINYEDGILFLNNDPNVYIPIEIGREEFCLETQISFLTSENLDEFGMLVEGVIVQTTQLLQKQNEEIHIQKLENEAIQQKIMSILESSSWKITKPLRAIKQLILVRGRTKK